MLAVDPGRRGGCCPPPPAMAGVLALDDTTCRELRRPGRPRRNGLNPGTSRPRPSRASRAPGRSWRCSARRWWPLRAGRRGCPRAGGRCGTRGRPRVPSAGGRRRSGRSRAGRRGRTRRPARRPPGGGTCRTSPSTAKWTVAVRVSIAVEVEQACRAFEAVRARGSLHRKWYSTVPSHATARGAHLPGGERRPRCRPQPSPWVAEVAGPVLFDDRGAEVVRLVLVVEGEAGALVEAAGVGQDVVVAVPGRG